MRKLWAGGKITHEGKFFTVRDAGISLKPVRPAARRSTSPAWSIPR